MRSTRRLELTPGRLPTPSLPPPCAPPRRSLSPPRAPQEFLQRESARQGSSALGRIAELLRANNPFATVLEEIEKMLGLLAAEGKKDAEHKAWCDEERAAPRPP